MDAVQQVFRYVFHTHKSQITFAKFNKILKFLLLDTIQDKYEQGLIVSTVGNVICIMGENIARDNGETEYIIDKEWN